MTRKGFMQGTHRALPPEETMQRIAPCADRVGITRVADLTGLDRVGIPVMAAYRPDARSVAVSLGKGVTPAAAWVSAAMESIELWHAEHAAPLRHWGSAQELQVRWRLAEWRHIDRRSDSAFDEATATAWVEAQSLLDEESALLPFEAVHTDGGLPEPLGSGHFLCTSNGLASGNNVAEAQVHALCELIERDAVARWQSAEDKSATLICTRTVMSTVCSALLEKLHAAGLSVLLHDATTAIGIPVMICSILDERNDPQLQMGMGCHLSREVAASRAVTEAAQSRLTLISGSRDDLFRDRYRRPGDAAALIKSIKAQLQAAGAKFERVPDMATDSLEGDRDLVVAALKSQSLHPYWVDLSQPEIGVAVGRAVVPGLRFPSADGPLP